MNVRQFAIGAIDGGRTVLRQQVEIPTWPSPKRRPATIRRTRDVARDETCRSAALNGIGIRKGKYDSRSRAGSELCRRLCHAVRAQVRQINVLGDQTRVLPCGLILKVSA